MRRIIVAVLFLCLYASPAFATREKIQGWCEQGGYAVTVPGTPGSGSQRFQQTYRSCTVTVYLVGTVTLATLYSNDAGTAQANPFTASSTGAWSFYSDGGRYDVRFSGGGIATPFTLGDFRIPNDVFDVTDFGAKCDGTTNDYTAINNARIAATAQTNGGTVLIPSNVSGSCVIGTNITFDSDVTLAFEGGGRLSISTGVTVTINGGFEAPVSQVIAGAGLIVFGVASRVVNVYPHWWGALGNGSADDTAEFQSAMTAISGADKVFRIPCGVYVVSGVTTAATETTILGDGYCSRISYVTAGADISNILHINQGQRITIDGLVLDGNRDVNASPALNGINVVGGDAIMIRNIWCEQMPGAASTSYGDCLEIGDSDSTETSDVVIDNVIAKNIFRNGISIEKTSRIAISNFNCFIMIGTNPGACIDYEPDGSQRAQEVVFTNITCNTAVHCILMTGDTGSNTTRANGLVVSNISSASTTDSAIFIHGSNISILGGTIKDSNTSVTTRGAVYVQGSTATNSQNVVVSGLNITTCDGYGVQVFGGSGVVITGNIINECNSHGIAILPAAVGVGGNGAVTITGNTITNNGDGGASSAGIFIDDDATHLVTGLTITGNVITDTQATATQDYAIDVSGAASSDQSTWTIGNNVTTGNQSAAFNGTWTDIDTFGIVAPNHIALSAGTTGAVVISGASSAATTDACNCGLYVEFDTTTDPAQLATFNNMRTGSTNENLLVFNRRNVNIGSITGDGTNVAYNTSSDERMKANIANWNIGALDLVGKLQVRQWVWRTTGESDSGFVAQELYRVYPRAVTPGNNDAVWGIDYGRLTPLAIRAIQEQQLVINDLLKRVTILEAK